MVSEKRKEHKPFYEILKSRDKYLSERIFLIKNRAKVWLRPLGKNDYIHSDNVEKYLSQLVPDKIKKQKMTCAEIFVLLAATYMHDVRRNETHHEKRVWEELTNDPDHYMLYDEFEAEAVGEVCYGHAPEAEKPLRTISNKFGIPSLDLTNPLDLRFLAALLRIGDEMDSAYTRLMGLPKDDIRKLVRFPNIDTKRWIIEFQCEPSNYDQWRTLKDMVDRVHQRLKEVQWVFSPKGLPYQKVEMNPKNPPLDRVREAQILAREYIELQHVREEMDQRLKRLEEEAKETAILCELRDEIRRIRDGIQPIERRVRSKVREITDEHPIWSWSEKVKGLSSDAGVYSFGSIKPEFTAPSIYRIFGLVPKGYMIPFPEARFYVGGQPRLGKYVGHRFRVFMRGVIDAKDPYYYSWYLKKKKEYRKKRRDIVENPKKCKDYKKCAYKFGRTVKKTDCKLHMDNLAKQSLTRILVTHAWETLCEYRGLTISRTKGGIPPRPA
jgi:hypothetical protein